MTEDFLQSSEHFVAGNLSQTPCHFESLCYCNNCTREKEHLLTINVLYIWNFLRGSCTKLIYFPRVRDLPEITKQEAQVGHCRSPEYNERVKKDLEVENVSANQRPGWPFCFSDLPEKHELGRGRWDLASCQVSFNSVQRFQRKSRKMSQPIRG